MTTRAAGVIAIALLLSPALLAQSLHPEKTILLPPGVVVRYTAVSPAGNFIAAVCRDQKLRLWDVASGSLSHTLDLAGQRLSTVRFSDNGQFLALGGSAGLVRLWDLPSATLKLEFTSPRQVEALAISPDTKLLAVAPLENAVEVWNVTTGKQVAQMRAPFSGTSALAFSPDSRWLATADGDTNIRAYDARAGALQSTTEDLLLEAFTIAYSTDGKYILTGGAGKAITIIDAASGKVLRSFPKEHDTVLDIRLSRDGKLLAAAYANADDPSEPSPVVIWDLDTQSPRTRILESGIALNGGEFLSDGRLLMTSGSEKELKVWSVR
jgi:WD40 repeat protein